MSGQQHLGKIRQVEHIEQGLYDHIEKDHHLGKMQTFLPMITEIGHNIDDGYGHSHKRPKRQDCNDNGAAQKELRQQRICQNPHRSCEGDDTQM